jgi:hypothetical protein
MVGGVPNLGELGVDTYVLGAVQGEWGLYLLSDTRENLAALDALPSVCGIVTIATDGAIGTTPWLDAVCDQERLDALNAWLVADGLSPIPAGQTYRQVIAATGAQANVAFDLDRWDVLEANLTAAELLALVNEYPLWVGGGTYSVGDLRAYAGQLYRCNIAHTNADPNHTPDVTQNLWTRVTPEGVMPIWVQPAGAHDAYPAGFVVSHLGHIWVSTIDANVWEPGVYGWERGDTAEPEEPTVAAWAAYTAYKIGDVVTYNGVTYECRQAHTSLPGWEPPNVLALWLPL